MDKSELRNFLAPRAALEALTHEASGAIPRSQRQRNYVSIHQFPYRVGRESRIEYVNGKQVVLERRKRSDSQVTNDLYLFDTGERLAISREHFLIREVNTNFQLLDRGSACGTMLNDSIVGAGNDLQGIAELKDGDVIHLGGGNSPYLYRFHLL